MDSRQLALATARFEMLPSEFIRETIASMIHNRDPFIQNAALMVIDRAMETDEAREECERQGHGAMVGGVCLICGYSSEQADKHFNGKGE